MTETINKAKGDTFQANHKELWLICDDESNDQDTIQIRV